MRWLRSHTNDYAWIKTTTRLSGESDKKKSQVLHCLAYNVRNPAGFIFLSSKELQIDVTHNSFFITYIKIFFMLRNKLSLTTPNRLCIVINIAAQTDNVTPSGVLWRCKMHKSHQSQGGAPEESNGERGWCSLHSATHMSEDCKRIAEQRRQITRPGILPGPSRR